VQIATGLFAHFLRGSAAAESTLSKKAHTQLKPHEDTVQAGAMTWVLASERDNRPVGGVTFTSEALARESLTQRTAAGAGAGLHVLPEYEAIQ
jgi:hypothetical protein